MMVKTFLIQQLLVSALFNDLSGIDHQYLIRIADGAQAMAITKLVFPFIRRSNAF